MFIATRRISESAEGSNPGQHVLEARTRDRVRQTISELGPLTAGALATRLGLTPAAVRRHLDHLAEQGAIEEHEPVRAGALGRRRGRPARAYILSEAGHVGLGSDCDHVATSALRFLADHAGKDAVREFAQERSDDSEQRYAAKLADAGKDVTARAEALAAALTADGFAASTRPVGQGTPLAGVQLCQGHCPVQHVAAQFPQFCDAETDAFSRLLGVHVQRLATLAHGEHVCTTFIPLSAVPVKATQALRAPSGKTTSDERPPQ
ncbi:MAG TPA: helix-turn-helix domain-containing protein [Dermatophilaceae bacterium]